MEIFEKLINWLSEYKHRYIRRIEVAPEQHQVIIAIADELKISKEEILWVFVEFGQSLAASSQENKAIYNAISKRNHFPEYKNWERISKLLYEFLIAGKK